MPRLVASLALLATAHAGDQCYTGIAGANQGPVCDKSKVYTDNEFKSPDCWSRSASKKCVENNKHVGMGDGCPEHEGVQHNDKATCEAARPDKKMSTDNSFDGSDRHCRWIPEKTVVELKSACEVDAGCMIFSTGTGCGTSTAAMTNQTKWEAQKGTDCKNRYKTPGCYENNGHFGESDRCTNHKDQTACFSQVTACSEGVCTGTATGSDTRACAVRSTSSGDCTGYDPASPSGCSWKAQCCQWVTASADPMSDCSNKGKGTLDGVCSWRDGNGPPSAETVKVGFEHSLFTLNDNFTTKCAVVASFRNGKGSATVLGSDKVDLLGLGCASKARWEGIGEHVGHTKGSIAEYCTNFIPDNSTMAALAKYTPSFLITKAEQGQFGAVFPGLKNLLFIVTAKPEFGKCLFTAEKGKWGTGICMCDTKECNNNAALNLIVDGDKGPMRLLQFIDGSLAAMKADINKVVPDLMNANGNLNKANVGGVTEANVVEIMNISGLAAKTNKDELWGITQDYQKLLKAEADYKTTLMQDPAYQALKIDPNKVAAANTAAGVELYGADGVPNTFALQSMSADKMAAVATSTGVTASVYTTATAQATADTSADASGAPRTPATTATGAVGSTPAPGAANASGTPRPPATASKASGPVVSVCSSVVSSALAMMYFSL